MNIRAGDWVLFEFKLAQVKQTEPYIDISDGWFSISGSGLGERCVPLTLDNVRISDTFHGASDRLHKEGHAGLNYPDIHRWLVDKWIRCVQTANEKQRNVIFDELDTFVKEVLKMGQEFSYGFPLIRRRAA